VIKTISDENFAKLFHPKPIHCGKILELEIDDLHFISYPCLCPQSDSASDGSLQNALSMTATVPVTSVLNEDVSFDGIAKF